MIERVGKTMKKKYGVIIISTLILIVSLTLIINKPSYAVIVPNYCPEQVIVTESNDKLELVPGLSLPKTLNIKTPGGDLLSNQTLTIARNDMFFGVVSKKTSEGPYPIPNFSENPNENRYYSQLFLWLLMDLDNEGNLTKEEKEAIASSENGKIVAEKIEEYKKITGIEPGEKTMVLDNINMDNITYHVTNDYIETSLITPESTNNYSFFFTDYIVETTSPVIVVDENGNEQTNFLRGEGFKLRIPISEINNNQINFSATVTGQATFNSWGMYEFDGTTTTYGVAYPTYIINCGQEETLITFEPLKISNSIEVGTVNIKVVDAETKEDLSDAEVVIIDSKGNEIYRYRTTSDTLTVTLPIGDYTIRQTVTPPNYEAKTIEQRVSVTANATNEVVLENIQLVTVPDTLKTTTAITIIGIIIILLGAGIILYIKGNKTKD